MKRALCSLLAVAVVTAAVPVGAAEKAATAPTSASAAPLQAAINAAGLQVTPLVVAPAAASSTGSVPKALPRSGSRRIRKQGGGMGMAMGVIGTVAGVAGTVYMVKQMKKNSDDANK